MTCSCRSGLMCSAEGTGNYSRVPCSSLGSSVQHALDWRLCKFGVCPGKSGGYECTFLCAVYLEGSDDTWARSLLYIAAQNLLAVLGTVGRHVSDLNKEEHVQICNDQDIQKRTMLEVDARTFYYVKILYFYHSNCNVQSLYFFSVPNSGIQVWKKGLLFTEIPPQRE